jgi:hypothetical protein
MSHSQKTAAEGLNTAREVLSGMRVEINQSKSGIGNLCGETIKFLGYEINSHEITSSSWNMEEF